MVHPIPTLLSQLPSDHLEEISFGAFGSQDVENDFPEPYDLRPYDLEEVDKILNEPRFHKLRRVIFCVRGFDNYFQRSDNSVSTGGDIQWLCDEIKERLPRLYARNLLIFDYESLSSQCIPCASSFFSAEVDIHRAAYNFKD